MTHPYRTGAPAPEPECCGRCCPTLGGCLYGVRWKMSDGSVVPAGLDYVEGGPTTTPKAVFRNGQWTPVKPR